jgi:hypothetical protein
MVLPSPTQQRVRKSSLKWGTPDEYLRPEDIDAIMNQWSYLPNDTLTALSYMLNNRNEKIDRFRNATKMALVALYDIDHRLGPGKYPCSDPL